MNSEHSNESCLEWLDAFKKKHGRPPSILHIGNIANNAYLNAKLLNEVGFDCDVICYDYYHIMGCPEWEDAEIEGEIRDQFNPEWYSVNLNGYERPNWFVQGPMELCIRYLIAKRTGNVKKQRYYWEFLSYANKTKMKRKDVYLAENILKIIKWYLVNLANMNRKDIEDALKKRLSFLNKFAPFLGSLAIIFFLIILFPVSLFIKLLTKESSFDERVKYLENTFLSIFLERADRLTIKDLANYRNIMPLWRNLFSYYDVIQAYATDPILPMLANKHPYIGYEHGTIRDIPFENDSTGRATLIAYYMADAIYLTNADSMEKAKYIRKDKNRLVYGIHGFDERRIQDRLSKINHLPKSSGRFGIDNKLKLFFVPARHHWRDGFPTWLKGNNKIIDAANMLTETYNGQFKIIFVEWGKEIDLSKKLIKDLGIEDHFHWINPIGKKDLINAYRSVDCIIDQFVLPCIGGITLEAMAVGYAPVITYLDDKIINDFFGESIPLFNCFDKYDIALAMETVITNPAECARKVVLCKDWIYKYHSHKVLIGKHIESFKIAGVM